MGALAAADTGDSPPGTTEKLSEPAFDPETLLLRIDDATLIARALRTLPDRFHQLLVLRELEGLSYRELADVMEIPIGTVMSRLARAREALRTALDSELTPARVSVPTEGTDECSERPRRARRHPGRT